VLALLLLILAAWYFIGRGDAPPPPQIGETAPLPSQSPVSQEPGARERAVAADGAASPGPAPDGRGDRAARPIAPQPPEYPQPALRGGVQGTVLVRVAVAADGRPTRVDIARSSGSRELDRAAQRAVEGWRFEPALKRGRPVPSVLEVPVEFRADTR
jgi:protein TonB